MAFTVGMVARATLRHSVHDYPEEFMQIISHLLDREFGIVEGDVAQIELELRKLASSKIGKLARLMKLYNWKEDKKEHERLRRAINEDFAGLQLIEYRELAREIKFLYNVSMTLLHW